MKKILIIALCIVILTGCSSDLYPSKETIFKYVNNNLSILEEITQDEIPKPALSEENKNYVAQKLSDNSIVEKVYCFSVENSSDIIFRFVCGGRGNVTSSIYVGFYYSPNNYPYAFQFEPCPLEEIEDGVYYWENEDRSRRFYTERIQENWFYYEMTWH